MAEYAAVAAAAGAVAVGNGDGASGGGVPSQPAVMVSEESFSATQALVAFLRMEADLAEQKAKRLREQAAELGQQYNVSQALQDAYGTCIDATRQTLVVRLFGSLDRKVIDASFLGNVF